MVKAQDKGVDALTEPGVDALRKTMLTFKIEEIKAALVKAEDTVPCGESETLLGD